MKNINIEIEDYEYEEKRGKRGKRRNVDIGRIIILGGGP